jgi:aminopeptidase N
MEQPMKIFVAALFVLATSGTAFAFDFDKTPGRLPKTIVPIDYSIAFLPDITAKTITGGERITLLVRSTTSQIVFNTLDMHVSAVLVDGKPAQRVVTQNDQQITTVMLARPLTPGHHVMTLAYTGKINTEPNGLFVQPYRTSSGTSGVMLSSQLESTDARRFFPCWDEPAFRAVFTLSATIPAAWSAVGNMPIANRIVHGSMANVTFQPTPKMSSYLVEFSAGDLAKITATSEGIVHSVWAVRGEEKYGRDALSASQNILNDYNAYFGFRYPLPKLDSIAIPGGFGGAMENWGAITYNDQLLLTGPSTTLEARQVAWDVQAHEMAHQWTGDLVTMDWWTNTWLNESFASWMETKETALRNPTWAWWESADAENEGAFDADGQPTSSAIETPVTNERLAETSFDPAIVYAKGRAVLRMFEEYLGEDTFRDGMRRYISAQAYSNAVGSDLWRALSAASGQDIASLASAWITQPGYPVVSVNAQCDSNGNRTVTLSQERFLWQGTDPKHERWNVPLQIQSGGGSIQRVVLKDDGQTVTAGKCDEALLLDAGAYGFYRVAYDNATLAANASGFASFSDPNKIALLDNQWALARAGRSGLGPYFEFAARMGSDLDARAWEQIIGSLTALESDERGQPNHDTLVQHARALVQPVVAQLGWAAKPGENPPTRDLRYHAILALGLWGDPAVIGEARRRFAIFEHDRTSLTPNQQTAVLPIVAAYADAAMFERLHKLARSARTVPEVRRFYGALVSVRDPKLAQLALQAVISDPLLPQAKSQRRRLIFAAAATNPSVAWAFFKVHGPAMLKGMPPFQRALFLADSLPRTFLDAAPPATVGAWLQSLSPPATAPFIKRGVAAADVLVAIKARLVAEVNTELSGTARN